MMKIDKTSNKFVKNFEDYVEHTLLHIERVRLLGLYLYKNNLHLYENLDISLVDEFLLLHDKGKVDKFLEIMYPYYGNKEHLSENEWKEFRKIIADLNSYDSDIAKKFFSQMKLSPEQEMALLQIEKLSDYVDRNLNPVTPEEFGMDCPSLDNFLDEYELELAEFIVHYYKKITGKYFI